MKNFYTLLIALTLSFCFFPAENTSANTCVTTCHIPFCEDYIYIRVHIGETRWVFVYTHDGSFITVYVDEDE